MIRKFIIFPLLIVLIVYGAWAYAQARYPAQMADISWRSKVALHNMLYDKELKYSGLNLLKPEDLEVSLPLERSNLWWQFNRALVKAALSSNPLVAKGDVRPCKGALPYNCFEIDVVERQARYIAELNGQEWVLGDDGTFIAPVPKKQRGQDLPGVVLLRGLGSIVSSPDALKAQLRNVQDSLEKLEVGTGRKVKAITLQGTEEFQARFDGLQFNVVMDVPKTQDELSQEVERLNKVLKEFQGKEELVRSIDLAYHKMAVVTLEKVSVHGDKNM